MDTFKTIFVKFTNFFERFTQKTNPITIFWEIKKSSIHGNGLFTKIDIPKNTLLFVGIDETITSNNGMPIVLQPGPLINHCVNRENIRLQKQGHVYRFITLRDIPKNSELIMNYYYTPNYIQKPKANYKSC
jgi:hypothetical protein